VNSLNCKKYIVLPKYLKISCKNHSPEMVRVNPIFQLESATPAKTEKGWRKIANPNISTVCLSCQDGVDETVLHRFHQCFKTRHTWHFAFSVLYLALKISSDSGTWPDLTWQQCILGSKLPRRLRKGTTMWSLFRGSVIWTV